MIMHVRVKPAQRADALWREAEGLVAHIRGVPKDGVANAHLEQYVAKRLGVPKSAVRVVKGAESKYKTIDVFAQEVVIVKALASLEDYPQSTLL